MVAAAPASAVQRAPLPGAAMLTAADAANATPAAYAQADPLAAPLAVLAATAGADVQADALRAQLARLQATTRGQWRPAAPLPAGTGTVVLDASGQPLGRLLQQGRTVVWQAADGAWTARLPAAAEAAAPSPP